MCTMAINVVFIVKIELTKLEKEPVLTISPLLYDELPKVVFFFNLLNIVRFKAICFEHTTSKTNLLTFSRQ